MADIIQRDSEPKGQSAGEGADELPYSLTLELLVKDRETIAALWDHEEGSERDGYAVEALKIGVLALRHAGHRMDADLIHGECTRMLESLQTRLEEHSRGLHQRLAGSLSEHFDPQSGRFNERLQRLIRKDGDLEQLLRRQIGQEDSELSKTLLVHLGQQSPLMKLLNPDESKGLISAFREALDVQLRMQRDRLLTEFSLDNKQGALSRLVGELTGRHGELNKDLRDKIDGVVKEFSLDEENSALSRLVRNVDTAQRTIRSEFSLDNPASAFSRLNGILEETRNAIHKNLTLDEEASPLSRLKREMLTILDSHAQRNLQFQEEVKVALGKLGAKREETNRSTRHGILFEEAVCAYIASEAQAVGDIAVATGHETGYIKNCKVGDGVVQLGPDSPSPGAKIVFEAKEDASYTLARACEEIDRARSNRGAQLGLFVFSKKSSPAGLEPFSRYGNDLMVIWDPEDPHTDIYIKAGLMTARALCIRNHRENRSQQVNFTEVEKAILEIEKRSNGLEEVTRSAQTIQNASGKILERIRLTRKALDQQIEILTQTMSELRKTED